MKKSDKIKKKYKNILKNKNFLNNQNYVLGNRLIKLIDLGMTEKGKDNHMNIGFKKKYKYQEIFINKLLPIKRGVMVDFIGLIIMSSLILSLVISTGETGFLILFLFLSIFVFMLAKSTIFFKRTKKYNFYRNKNRVLIVKK